MSRDYPDRPVVAVGVVVVRGNDVLLIRRGKPPLVGAWSLPGGAQHVGETTRQTATREVREETGVTIALGGLIDVVDYIDRADDGAVRHHYSLIDFWARPASDAPPVPGDDASAAQWWPLEALPGLDLWEETMRVILQAHDMAARS